MESIIIYLTYRCNLQCDYCFVDKKDKTIEIKTLRKIIKWFIAQKGDVKKISLMGGEPLLCIDILDNIGVMIDDANAENKEVIIKPIPTNGTILDEEILIRLKSRGLSLSFSLDGKFSSHNAHRTKDEKLFHNILDNIELYTEHIGMPEIKLTIAPEQACNLYSNVEWILNKGFRKLHISPAFGQVWNKEQTDHFKEQFSRVAVLYLKHKTEDPVGFSMQPIDQDITRILNNDFMKNPNCGLGKEIVFTPDGEAFACTLIMHIDDEILNSKMKLGHIDSNIDLIKMKELESFKICDRTDIKCKHLFPVVSCNKLCTCFDFKNRKLFSSNDILNMAQPENDMFIEAYNIVKNLRMSEKRRLLDYYAE